MVAIFEVGVFTGREAVFSLHQFVLSAQIFSSLKRADQEMAFLFSARAKQTGTALLMEGVLQPETRTAVTRVLRGAAAISAATRVSGLVVCLVGVVSTRSVPTVVGQLSRYLTASSVTDCRGATIVFMIAVSRAKFPVA